jgi:hypothetical protein
MLRHTFCASVLLFTSQTLAQGILNPVVEGDSLRADVEVGAFTASLVVRFENVVGLNAANLGLSARVLNPLSANVLPRLGSGVSLTAAFPLAIRIEPPEAGGLSFSGIVSIELYTHDLQYTVGSPLRLYSGPDLRPLSSVIESKYASLSELLARHGPSIGGELTAELQGLKNASEQSSRSGETVNAITYIEAFADKVKAASGKEIPDVWRSSRDVTNVAGALRAAAGTLRFSLTLASNS